MQAVGKQQTSESQVQAKWKAAATKVIVKVGQIDGSSKKEIGQGQTVPEEQQKC